MKIKNLLIAVAIFMVIAPNYGFKHNFDEQDWLAYSNRCLEQCYDLSADPKIKKVEISITSDYFVRLRKTYARDMQQYYSFSLQKFSNMDYLGSTNGGTLQLKTTADDIIVQTYNDRHGDVDSMTTVLNIPVKNMEPERLDSLQEAFDYFKAKEL